MLSCVCELEIITMFDGFTVFPLATKSMVQRGWADAAASCWDGMNVGFYDLPPYTWTFTAYR